ncbi:MAG: hypothetical protein ACLTCV_11650 [Oscillospiraceae bacterium]
MKHNRGGFLVAVLLLVIAVAVAGIVYYVLRITQTGPATATGGVEPTEPSSSAAPTGAPETDAPAETEAPTETTSPEELAAQEILDGMTLDEKLCQLFVVTPDALTGLSPRHGGRGRHARGAGTHARRRAGVFRAEHRIGRAGHADAADRAELQQDPAAAGRG